MARRRAPRARRPRDPRARRAGVAHARSRRVTLVSVLGGKGGVGKTNVACNLAVAAAARGARVLLVDGDLGLANVDVLLGLVPRGTLADVAAGRARAEEVLVRGPRGVDVLPAASGRSEMAALAGEALAPLLGAIVELARGYDVAFVDAAPGVGAAVVAFAAVSARRIVVATPEPTSLADAYALLKVMRRDAGAPDADLLVNAVRHEREARDTQGRLARLVARFLDLELRALGWLPRDARLVEAVALQRAVVEAFPASAVARRIGALADTLLEHAAPLRDAQGAAAEARA
ncbi:MAG: cobyrinic acid a,c-diamide synthase [Proteobacteria bacterium]|nr:MAG: cobyrinic acid a,c-diamide synthase [Pseudomonadota bacterium]